MAYGKEEERRGATVDSLALPLHQPVAGPLLQERLVEGRRQREARELPLPPQHSEALPGGAAGAAVACN